MNFTTLTTLSIIKVSKIIKMVVEPKKQEVIVQCAHSLLAFNHFYSLYALCIPQAIPSTLCPLSYLTDQDVEFPLSY